MPHYSWMYDDDITERPQVNLRIPVDQLSDLDIPVGGRDLGILELPVIEDPAAAMKVVRYWAGE